MAYTATPLSKEQLSGSSNYRVIFEFTSNTPATEPTFRKELLITPEMTIQQGREWLFRQINESMPKKSVADLIVVGTPVVPLAPAAPTAFQVWRTKLQRLSTLRAAGTATGTGATEIDALASDVWTTYQAGFVAQV